VVFVTLLYHSFAERECLVSFLVLNQVCGPDKYVGVTEIIKFRWLNFVDLVFNLIKVAVVDLSLFTTFCFQSHVLGYWLAHIVLHCL